MVGISTGYYLIHFHSWEITDTMAILVFLAVGASF